MKTTKTVFVSILMALCVIFFGCSNVRRVPDCGKWYCEDLQAHVNFDLPDDWDPLNNDESGVYIVEDGEIIACVWTNDPGSSNIYISCQESDHDRYRLGEIIYCLEFVSLSDSEYVVKDDAGKQYTFVRTS